MLGFPAASRVADRYGLAPGPAEDALLDFEARGRLADTGGPARPHGVQRSHRLAPGQVDRGDRAWVDGPGRDPCHILWIQFHEDLLATLGIPRGSDS